MKGFNGGIGTMSSKGQISIPSEIREKLGLEKGNQVLFYIEGNALVMAKVTEKSVKEFKEKMREYYMKVIRKELKLGLAKSIK